MSGIPSVIQALGLHNKGEEISRNETEAPLGRRNGCGAALLCLKTSPFPGIT